MGMKSYMMRIKWKEELKNKNIEEMWCTFLIILNKCRNKYVPKKTGEERKNAMHLDIRKYLFSQRVIDYWNALPQTAIDAKSINMFKNQLKIHLNNIIRGLHKPLAFSLFPTPLLN